MFLRDQSPLSLLLAIIAVLLLGALLNILVAWGLVCWTPPIPATTEAVPFWPAQVPQDWPKAEETVSARSIGLEYVYAYGISWDEVSTAPKRAHRDNSHARLELLSALQITPAPAIAIAQHLRAGWPRLSLSCDLRRLAARDYPTGQDAATPLNTRTGLAIPDWIPWCEHEKGETRRLPTRIIPAGFAINTLLYAAVCTFMIVGFKAFRYRHRTRAGHCPVCNYDLRGGPHSLCPECGAMCEVGP